MARTARQSEMRILQGKVSETVGESGFIQLVDIRIPAEMFGVAAAAFAGGCRHPAVIACPGADVGSDVAMALEA